MRRTGSHTLDEFPLPVVRVACERCGRAGLYHRDRLIARFGADAALPDVLLVERSRPARGGATVTMPTIRLR